MRMPVRHVAGNLIWTSSGVVWAVWRVITTSYRHTTSATKRDLLGATEALLKALPREFLLMSFCPQTEAADVVRRMIADVPLEQCPDWVDACDTTLEALTEINLHERTHWLAAPLPSPTGVSAANNLLATARSSVAAAFGLIPPRPRRVEIEDRASQARRLVATLPGAFQLRDATAAEIFWLYARSLRRGLDEPPLPTPDRRDGVPALATLSDVIMDEGAKTDRALDSGVQGRASGRVLKVVTGDGASYQALLTLAEMPETFVFPGAEWLANIDDFGFPIDWAVRVRSVSSAEAEAKSRRQARELSEQVGEYHGETAGVPAALQDARTSLDEYRARLSASASEVELQATVIFCVSSSDPDQVEERADSLRNGYASNDFQIVRPIGDQLALYHAMLPGYPSPRAVRDYVQYLLAHDFAMSVPLAGGQLGDDAGGLLGFSFGGGTRPVIVDPTYGPRVNASASAGWVGELGAGKSVGMKVFMWMLLARDPLARALVVDRTPMEEWVKFARACPGETQVIQVGESAAVNLDPLRIFPGARAGRYADSFLTLLLGTSPMDIEGVTLGEAVDAVVRGPDPSMRKLLTHLEEQSANGDQVAGELTRRLRVVASKDLSRVIFDDSLPPLETADVAGGGAASVVFATAGLNLPTKDELSSEFRMKRLEFEKVFGRACLYLIAALCREVSFADQQRFVGVFFDECWWLTSSVEGQELLLEQIRDGRKHYAGAFLGSHDPGDFGNETVRGLLSHRFLFRHRSRALAARGLEFVGLDPDDPDLLDFVTKDLSPVNGSQAERLTRAGECLYRHLSGAIEPLKILLPPVPGVAEAIATTPTTAGPGAMAGPFRS